MSGLNDLPQNGLGKCNHARHREYPCFVAQMTLHSSESSRIVTLHLYEENTVIVIDIFRRCDAYFTNIFGAPKLFIPCS